MGAGARQSLRTRRTLEEENGNLELGAGCWIALTRNPAPNTQNPLSHACSQKEKSADRVAAAARIERARRASASGGRRLGGRLAVRAVPAVRARAFGRAARRDSGRARAGDDGRLDLRRPRRHAELLGQALALLARADAHRARADN